VTFAGNNLVLKLTADGGEIGVITGDTHQKVPVGIRVLLSVPQNVGVYHVYLQGAAAVFRVAAQEGCEFRFMLGVTQQGGVEGYSMAGPLGSTLT
jgi:hypothetical protein